VLNLGQETPVVVDGKVYRLSVFNVGMLEKWSAKIAEWEGDPYEAAKALISHVSPEVQREMLAEAKEQAKELKAVGPGSRLWEKWMQTPQGVLTFARLWLEQNHPDIDDMTAMKVFAKLGEDEIAMQKAIKNAQGTLPPNSPTPADEPGKLITTNSGTTSTVG
jgi:hypothetical protein